MYMVIKYGKVISCSKQILTVNKVSASEDLQQREGKEAKGIRTSCSSRKRLHYNNMTAVSGDILMAKFRVQRHILAVKPQRHMLREQAGVEVGLGGGLAAFSSK